MRAMSAFAVLLFSILAGPLAGAVSAQTGEDTIVQLSESVFRRGTSSNVFVVTSEGIIVIDGTCAGGGQEWLKAELERRYDVPVKYVVLSHDHEMHICGTQVYGDTAVTIAHRNARPHIVRERRNSAVPDITFEDSMDIHLGGKKVVLYYFGPTHSDNLIQVHVPDEGILVAPDIVRSGRALGLPDFRDSEVHNLVRALRELARLDDVEVVVPGHGAVGTQESFDYFREYLQALRDRVLDELVAGRSVEEIVERVSMEDFADYDNFGWVRANVITMWDYLYRYREPSEGLGEYQSSHPLGFPIGGQ